jgi:hypothetical protein
LHVTRYGPRSGKQWFYIQKKPVLRANHTIYTTAAYVVTFARLYSYGTCK